MSNEQKRAGAIIAIVLLLILAGILLFNRQKPKTLPSPPAPLSPTGQGLTPEQKQDIIKQLMPKQKGAQPTSFTPEQRQEIIEQLAPPKASSENLQGNQQPSAPKTLTEEEKKRILEALSPKK